MLTTNLIVDKTAFNPIYFPLTNCRKRYLHLFGGSGSGKSYFAAQKSILKLISEERRRLLVIRKVGRTIRNSCFALLTQVIQEFGLSHLFSIVNSRLEITCKTNGNTIICSGIDDPEKLKSIHEVTDIWIEEATEITDKDFDQLDLRLRGKFANYFQMILTYNPIYFYHWLRRDFHDKKYKIAKDGRGLISDSTVILKTTYKDNKKIDAAYADTTLKRILQKDPLFYAIYGEGDWTVPKGLIYGGNYKIITESDLVAVDKFYGLDFGFNNPMALTECRIKDEENIQVNQCIYESGLLTKDLISRMKDMQIGPKIPIYADPASPDKINEIKRAGFNVIPANNSVIDGIDYIKNFTIEVTENSVDGIKELNLYKYEERNGEPTEKPLKKFDHFCDSMRYGVHTHGKKYGLKGYRGGAIKASFKRS